jgi:hypothetical protein
MPSERAVSQPFTQNQSGQNRMYVLPIPGQIYRIYGDGMPLNLILQPQLIIHCRVQQHPGALMIFGAPALDIPNIGKQLIQIARIYLFAMVPGQRFTIKFGINNQITGWRPN